MNLLREIKTELSKNALQIKSVFMKCPKCNSYSINPCFHHINSKNNWEAEYFCYKCNEIVARSW